MNKKFKIFLLVFLLASVEHTFSQIMPNETLVYYGAYDLSGMMTNFAQITLRTEPVKTSTKRYLRLSAQVATFAKWDSYFKMRDLYESYVNPYSLKPTLFKRSVLEGKYIKKEKYVFNTAENSVTCVSKKMNRPEETSKIAIGSTTLDVVSLVYKIRTIDFSKMTKGQSMRFTLLFDKKEHYVWIKMMGTETVNAGNLGKKECYKLSISAKTNKLKGVDKNLIWLTTDTKKIPCLIKFSIPVGVGQVTLAKATGI